MKQRELENEQTVGSAPSAPPPVDDELQALTAVGQAISRLSPDGAERVLRYFLERQGRSVMTGRSESTQAPAQRSEFGDFVSLYDAANPRTGPERALVAAFWFQEVLRNDDWDSQTINSDLKNLGHGSANITADLRALSERTPRLALQVRKGGTSAQARKRYKLTREGVKAVQAMIRQEPNV